MRDTIERPYDPAIEASLRQAYTTALSETHACGTVQIHLGSAVVEYLRQRYLTHRSTLPMDPVIWGYPIITDERYLPEHVAIHVVRVIA